MVGFVASKKVLGAIRERHRCQTGLPGMPWERGCLTASSGFQIEPILDGRPSRLSVVSIRQIELVITSRYRSSVYAELRIESV